MRRSTLTKLGLLIFGLISLAFLIRGFGQFLVGQRTATMVGGPVAVLAAGVLVLVILLWSLGRLGLVTLEDDDGRE